MLRLFAILFIASFTYGCSGNETEKHTHDDGTIHEAHDESAPHEHSNSPNTQEEFTVGDSTKTDVQEHDHPHDDDHKHEGDHKH